MNRQLKGFLFGAGLTAGILFVLYKLPGVSLRMLRAVGQRAAKLKHNWLRTNRGQCIAYLRGGQGEPLVCIHGFAGDKYHWSCIARFLTPFFDLIALDLPGFGESPRNTSDSHSISEQVESIHEFTRTLGLERFHLAGHSMGGQVATAYVAKYPSRVASLWLIAPAGVMRATKSEVIEQLQEGKNPLIVKKPEDLLGILQLIFHAPPWLPRPLVYYVGEQIAESSSLHEKIFNENFEKPIAMESLVKGIKVPTFITWGRNDRVVDHSGAGILQELIPMSEISIREETGHVPIMEQPKEVAAEFLHFLHRDENFLSQESTTQ